MMYFFAKRHLIYFRAMPGPTPAMVSRVKPMLEQYRVAAYFCGHDHDMQLLNDGNGVDYFVVGGGYVLCVIYLF